MCAAVRWKEGWWVDKAGGMGGYRIARTQSSEELCSRDERENRMGVAGFEGLVWSGRGRAVTDIVHALTALQGRRGGGAQRHALGLCVGGTLSETPIWDGLHGMGCGQQGR